MGRIFTMTLEGKIYRCKHCGTHLAFYDDIASKAFHCRHGKAYLFNKVRLLPATLLGARAALASRDSNKSGPKERKKSTSGKISFCVNFYRINITAGAKEERMMMTGLHTVADIYCVCCGSNVGWKYETAHERSQRYKEGKSVLERFKILGPDGSNYMAGHEAYVGGSDADDV